MVIVQQPVTQFVGGSLWIREKDKEGVDKGYSWFVRLRNI